MSIFVPLYAIYIKMPMMMPPPPLRLLPLTLKPFELKLWYSGQRIYGYGECTEWLSMTLTQGHSCGIDKQKFACLLDKVRNNHPITTERNSFIAVVMFITCWNFEGVLLTNFILVNFLLKFRMCFFKVKHYFGHILGMVGPIDVKQKGSASVGYWV